MGHDPAKRRKYLRKYKVDLPRCTEAFDYPTLTAEGDREHDGEQRFVSICLAHGKAVVLV